MALKLPLPDWAEKVAENKIVVDPDKAYPEILSDLEESVWATLEYTHPNEDALLLRNDIAEAVLGVGRGDPVGLFQPPRKVPAATEVAKTVKKAKARLKAKGFVPDRYWLEVAYQTMKMDLQTVMGRFNFTIVVRGGAGYKDRWALKNHPEGRGVDAATKGREARAHYKRMRGFLPG